MTNFCGAHRAPGGRHEPVRTASEALDVITMAMHHPPTPQTIALVLDGDRRGRSIVVVDGTTTPDAVLDVVERVVDSIAATGEPGCLVVASIRPGGGPVELDDDRWLEASDLADDRGVELLEWFVVGGDRPTAAAHAWCPRDLLGEPPRWQR